MVDNTNQEKKIRKIEQHVQLEYNLSDVPTKEIKHKLFGVMDCFFKKDSAEDVYIWIAEKHDKWDNRISITNFCEGIHHSCIAVDISPVSDYFEDDIDDFACRITNKLHKLRAEQK